MRALLPLFLYFPFRVSEGISFTVTTRMIQHCGSRSIPSGNAGFYMFCGVLSHDGMFPCRGLIRPFLSPQSSTVSSYVVPCENIPKI